MLFKIFQIRKMVKQGMQNPGGLANEETRGAITGLLVLPALGVLLWLALMFILGFTDLLGGPWWFFKFVFIVSAIGTAVIGTALYKLIRLAGKAAQKTTEHVLQKSNVRDVDFTVKQK